MPTTEQKLLPPSNSDPGSYPVGASFNRMREWQEAKAQMDAFNTNQNDLVNWKTTTWGNWINSYTEGRLPWDSTPPVPPLSKFALMTETTYENGATGVGYDLVVNDNPKTAVPLCDPPAYVKEPPPQGGTVSLMQKQVDEGAAAVNTITLPKGMKVNASAQGSDGGMYLRVA